MNVWIGIDPGEKRTGIARSDALGMLASPVDVLGSYSELVSYLQAEESELKGVVLGLPRNMDGSYGPLAKRSWDLISRLRKDLSLKFILWDERLTTQQAVRISGGKKRGQVIDHKAAAILLQSFLDAGAPDRPDPIELSQA